MSNVTRSSGYLALYRLHRRNWRRALRRSEIQRDSAILERKPPSEDSVLPVARDEDKEAIERFADEGNPNF